VVIAACRDFVMTPNCDGMICNGFPRAGVVSSEALSRGHHMRAILLWALGLPIPIIILLYLFHVI
jgi:hypothetical protein